MPVSTPAQIAKVVTFNGAFGTSYSASWEAPKVLRLTAVTVNPALWTHARLGTSGDALHFNMGTFRDEAQQSHPPAQQNLFASGTFGSGKRAHRCGL
mgnify:CR=1 FL=1